MQVADGSLTLTAGGDDEGRAEEELEVEFAGDQLIIAFNPTYLLDGLGVVHAGTVRLAFTTSSPPGGDHRGATATATVDFRYLVMPARLPG